VGGRTDPERHPALPPPPEGEVVRVARRLRAVGWMMVAWSGLCVALGLAFVRQASR
jgi:hypothetical protein